MPGKQVISVPDGPPAYPFLSPAVRAGDFVFVSGHCGLVPGHAPEGSGRAWKPGAVAEGGIVAETRQALDNIKLALQAAGASLADVVKVNTILRDMDRDFVAYNDVYQTYFPTQPPARMTIGGKIFGEMLVEIECVAYAPMDREQR